MPGKFEVYEDSAGRFRFRLKASNGEVVAQSGEPKTDTGHFPSKAAARKGCASILLAADGAPIIEVDR